MPLEGQISLRTMNCESSGLREERQRCATTSVSDNTTNKTTGTLVTHYSRTLKHQYKHFLPKHESSDNIRDSPETQSTIQVCFCTCTASPAVLTHHIDHLTQHNTYTLRSVDSKKATGPFSQHSPSTRVATKVHSKEARQER